MLLFKMMQYNKCTMKCNEPVVSRSHIGVRNEREYNKSTHQVSIPSNDVNTCRNDIMKSIYRAVLIDLLMSTPVMFCTMVGSSDMMPITYPVSFDAPMLLSLDDTIVIFLVCDNGAATSAAILCMTSSTISIIFIAEYWLFLLSSLSAQSRLALWLQ